MMVLNIGRLCVKIAGRDAGKKCVVVEQHGNMVLVDGETRRKKVNIIHLEPTTKTLDVKESAPHSDIVAAFSTIGIELKAAKTKAKTARPKKARKAKPAAPVKAKPASAKPAAQPAKATPAKA
ncbi:50S ribosomal protein L14e [Candidatus Woesearchaeota archaeon]|nr:50S ribosomal protein L14e [Candidatus Woesearchaeota archaeon]